MLGVFFIGLLIAGVLLIWKGSDWLTDSMVPLARRLGTSYIAITTLLVSLLMSMPELFSSLYSYVLGHPQIGLGVLIGSVMANIGLSVGISAMIRPLKVERDIIIRDGIFLISVVTIIMVMGADLAYSRIEGAVLFLMFIPYVLNVWYFEKARPHGTRKDKVSSIAQNLDIIGDDIDFLKLRPSIMAFLAGGALLFVGSYLFSYSLINVAQSLSLPDLLVGFLFGGLGTAVPNIAAAIQGTLKGYKDAAITETFGSNIFTLLVTLAMIMVLSPFTIPPKVFYYDLTWMIVIHLLMVAFIIKGYRYREESLTRYEGTLLLVLYIALLIANIMFF